ncbi:MAG: protein kinase, partial [Myxococcota bacterium]
MVPEPDRVVADRYRLDRQLAKGGMGTVWVARHIELDVDVAIKFIADDLVENEVGRRRFKREARAAARLKSPHVTHIHDYGLCEGTPYIAMELLAGEALDERLDAVGHLHLDEAQAICRQLASGLRIAHEAGIVHRDLKPSNIFLAQMGDRPLVKILDFGIAKETKSTLVVGSETASGALIGSPRYMSPEQALGESVTHRSDLWSFGVVVFEMLAGVCPFTDEHLGQLINSITRSPHPSPRQFVEELPASVDTFFARALAKDPADRFDSASALSDAFTEITQTPTPSPEPISRTVVPGAARVDGNEETLDLPVSSPSSLPGPLADTAAGTTRDEPEASSSSRSFLALGFFGGSVALALGLWARGESSSARGPGVSGAADAMPSATMSPTTATAAPPQSATAAKPAPSLDAASSSPPPKQSTAPRPRPVEMPPRRPSPSRR